MTRLPDLSVSLDSLSDEQLRELQRSLLQARVPKKVKERKSAGIEVQTKAKKAEKLKTLSTDELLKQLALSMKQSQGESK